MEKKITQESHSNNPFVVNISNELLSSFGKSDISSERSLALMSDKIGQYVRIEVTKILKDKNNNLFESLKIGINTLLENGHINEIDVKMLNKVCALIIAHDTKKKTFEEAFGEVNKIHSEMSFDKRFSPTALAIIGSVNYSKSNNSSLVVTEGGSIPDGAANGALAGGILGGVIGGPFGSALGGMIGGAIGGVIGSC